MPLALADACERSRRIRPRIVVRDAPGEAGAVLEKVRYQIRVPEPDGMSPGTTLGPRRSATSVSGAHDKAVEVAPLRQEVCQLVILLLDGRVTVG